MVHACPRVDRVQNRRQGRIVHPVAATPALRLQTWHIEVIGKKGSVSLETPVVGYPAWGSQRQRRRV